MLEALVFGVLAERLAAEVDHMSVSSQERLALCSTLSAPPSCKDVHEHATSFTLTHLKVTSKGGSMCTKPVHAAAGTNAGANDTLRSPPKLGVQAEVVGVEETGLGDKSLANDVFVPEVNLLLPGITQLPRCHYSINSEANAKIRASLLDHDVLGVVECLQALAFLER